MVDLLLLIIEKLIQVTVIGKISKKLIKTIKLWPDLIVNHGSSKSKWFENFINQSGKGKDFFILLVICSIFQR